MKRRFFYRTEQGGRHPLSGEQVERLISLYQDYGVPVKHIAGEFGYKSSGPIYRILALIGARPWSEMTKTEQADYLHNRTLAKRSRKAA